MNPGTKSKGMQSLKRELPAKISEDETALIKSLAKKTFRVLACEGVARIDFIKDEQDKRVYVTRSTPSRDPFPTISGTSRESVSPSS